jgi:hypothetical protein
MDTIYPIYILIEVFIERIDVLQCDTFILFTMLEKYSEIH